MGWQAQEAAPTLLELRHLVQTPPTFSTIREEDVHETADPAPCYTKPRRFARMVELWASRKNAQLFRINDGMSWRV